MKIYNSIEKKNVELRIINNKVSIYLCGPTVYNHVHIGNIRPIIIFDVLTRVLRIFKVDVTFIHNITDIDDKIIAQSKIEQKKELELSNYYFLHYKNILDKLNISKGIYFPRVSEHISGIIKYTEELFNKNIAYEVNGNLYFSINKIPNYGSISNKKISELEIGARIEENNEKKDPFDFVIWKKTTEGIRWKSNFSYGRPGWHTECVYLINKYIGKTVDIHGGGVDLKFPHHENENAQNMGMFNKELAKHWMHIGHLTVNETKMSKSKNNYIYAKDILEVYSANAIRWFFYQTKYSNPINFEDEYLQNANDEIEKILYDMNIFKSYLIINDSLRPIMLNAMIFDDLLNDLNIPNTITFINQELKNAHKALRENEFSLLNMKYNIVFTLLYVLGISVNEIHNEKNINDLIKWNKLKNEKNYVQADVLRKELIKNKLL